MWGFRLDELSRRTMTEWHGVYVWPSSKVLYDYLFAKEPIEWNRECSHQ